MGTEETGTAWGGRSSSMAAPGVGHLRPPSSIQQNYFQKCSYSKTIMKARKERKT